MVHEGVVALRMFLRQAHILVHIERDHILEGKLPVFHHTGKFPVSFYRSGSGAKTENKWLVAYGSLLLDSVRNVVSGPEGALSTVFFDDKFHIFYCSVIRTLWIIAASISIFIFTFSSR